MPGSAFKRSGLHRLECQDCPGYVYATVAALEAHGLPRCGCGAGYWPARPELSMLLGLDDCPHVVKFMDRLSGFEQGQHSTYVRKGHDGARSSYDAVAEEFAADYREAARERRLIGLKFGAPTAAPVPDPMPF